MLKGSKMSEESKAKMRAAWLHRKPTRTGIKHTPESRRKISERTRERQPRGAACYNFSHGRSERRLNDRRRPEYRAWREDVFARDKYTCQKCGDARGGNLRAHHVRGFATHPELRFEVSNGVTLCHPCHELEHFKPDSTRNVRKLKRGEKLWH
jgi:5-methylcytosine-specific restriction endonuclease McrA